MSRYALPGLLSLWAAVVLPACAAPATPELALGAPWQDGAQSSYEIRSASGAVVGTSTFAWQRDGEGWKHTFSVNLRGKKDTGWVQTDGQLRPVHSLRESGSAKVEATYGASEVVVQTSESGGAPTEKKLARPPFALDNDQSLETQRAFPLADGFTATYENVVTRAPTVAAIRVSVVGSETITVPAGQFETWHLKMAGGGKPHDAWYAKAPPHLMIRYVNTGSGSELMLRSWKASKDSAVQGDPTPPVVAASGSVALSWGSLAVALLVAFPLMIVLPIALGVMLSKKLGVSGKLWGLGALSFVASQIVHIPLNWAVGLLGGAPRALGTLPMPWLALALGLSAGLCEELARYVFLRFVARKAKRTWAEALQFGAGHGGIEAIIIGVLLGLTFVSMILLHFVPPATLGVPPSAAGEVAAAVDAFWSQPWYTPAVGGIERVSAMTAHIGMTVLVMRSVSRHNPLYLLAAIGAHTAVDAGAVWSISHFSTAATEALVGVMAAGLLALTLALREESPSSPPAQA